MWYQREKNKNKHKKRKRKNVVKKLLYTRKKQVCFDFCINNFNYFI